LIRAAQLKGEIPLQNGEAIPFKVYGREQVLRIVIDRASPWKSTDIHKVKLVSDFDVSGLETHNYEYGLGVPLIGIRETTAQKGERPPAERFFPPEMAFPLTAFLTPNSRLRDPVADVRDARECTLVLFDPMQTRTVGPPPNVLALETDLTTPLAYMWS